MSTSSDRIKNIITEMIFKDSYWGYLFSKINRKEDKTIPSALGVTPEIDGSITLLYNPLFIDKGGDDFLSAGIEHEGTHILNHHIPRLLRIISDEVDVETKLNKSTKWNYASDCAVNTIINIKKSYILSDGFEFKIIHPDLYNLPPRKNSEFYYENIPDDQVPKTKVMYVSGNGGKGSGNIGDHESWTKNISKVSDVSSLASRMDQYTDSALEESYNNVRNK